MSIYHFNVKTIDGEKTNLGSYKGKVLVIVNVASECGFTYQYEGLEALYAKYKAKGVEVLGFPSNQFAGQEPGTDDEVKKFCTLTYGVDFPMFSKIDVRGDKADPLFAYLTAQAPFKGIDETKGAHLLEHIKKTLPPEYLKDNDIKWNFTKFVVNQNGDVVARFESPIEPAEVGEFLETLL